MINFKTWPFKVIEIKRDHLTSVVLMALAVEQPLFTGVYPLVDTQGKQQLIYVWVEGHGVVSGIFADNGMIILSCR